MQIMQLLNCIIGSRKSLHPPYGRIAPQDLQLMLFTITLSVQIQMQFIRKSRGKQWQRTQMESRVRLFVRSQIYGKRKFIERFFWWQTRFMYAIKVFLY